MSRGRAPTAMRRPISRVRSVTDTSMIAITNTPPTSSAMPATTSSSRLIRFPVELTVLFISVMSRIWKSSGWPGRRWCRSRSSSVTSLMADSISPCERTCT